MSKRVLAIDLANSSGVAFSSPSVKYGIEYSRIEPYRLLKKFLWCLQNANHDFDKIVLEESFHSNRITNASAMANIGEIKSICSQYWPSAELNCIVSSQWQNVIARELGYKSLTDFSTSISLKLGDLKIPNEYFKEGKWKTSKIMSYLFWRERFLETVPHNEDEADAFAIWWVAVHDKLDEPKSIRKRAKLRSLKSKMTEIKKILKRQQTVKEQNKLNEKELIGAISEIIERE